MSLRTIKYLVVDNIVDDVPDAAPEIDVPAGSAHDVAAALMKTAGVPGGSEIYLQTFRPDGSARWQPINAVEVLPEVSIILAKIVRGRGQAARPATQHAQQQQYRPQQEAAAAHHGGSSSSGVRHALGGLFKKLAVGGGTAGAGSAGMGRVGGGMGGMGGMGGGGFGRRNSDEEDEYQRQLYEQQQLQELEDGAMRRDDDDENRHGWIDMDNNVGPEPEECHSDEDRDGGNDDGGNQEGGDWVEMDNTVGPDPEECDNDGDNDGDGDNDDNDDNDNDFDDNDNDNDD